MSEVTTWFETEYGRISQVQAVGNTEKSVTLRKKRFYIDSTKDEFEEVRRSRISDRRCYFPTWAEAHEHLMRRAEAKVRSARNALKVAHSEYGNVKGMKPSAPTP